MQKRTGLRTPPRSSVTSGYSVYSSGSEDFHARMLAVTRNADVTNHAPEDASPTTPSSRILMDEYVQAARMSDAARDTMDGQRPSYDINNVDPLAMHLLLETAMADSQDFRILSLDELDRLKKEEIRVSRLIEAGKKKLYLESRVDDTAKLLQRLGTKGQKNAGPAPPLSPTKQRFMRFRSSITSGNSADVNGAEDRSESTSAKIEELTRQLWRLEKSREDLHNRRLEHTAGVLQLNNHFQTHDRDGQTVNAEGEYNSWDSSNNGEYYAWPLTHSLDGTLEVSQQQNNTRNRLQVINSTLHGMMGEYEMGNQLEPPPPLDAHDNTDSEFSYLEKCLALVNERHWQLRDYLETSRQLNESHLQQSQQSNDFMEGLWTKVSSTEEALRKAGSEDDSGVELPYSSENFGAKIQVLCDRAALLTQQQQSLSNQLMQEREDRRKENSAKAKERSRLINQLTDSNEKVSSGRKALEESQSLLVETKTLLVQAHQELELSKQKAEQLAQECNSRKTREHDLTSRLAAKVHETGFLRSAITAHEAKIATLESSHSTATEQLEENRTTLESLGASLYAAESQLATYQASAGDRSREVDRFDKEKERLEGEAHVLREELGKISANLLDAEDRANTHETSARTNAKQLVQSESERQDAAAEVARLREELGALSMALQDAETRAATNERLARRGSRQVAELTSTRQDLENKVERLNKELTAANVTLNDTRNLAQMHEESARTWTGHASQIDLAKQQLEDEVARLNNDFISVRAELETSLNAKVAELLEMTSKHQTLLQNSENSRVMREHLENTVTAQAQELDELSSNYRTMEKQLEVTAAGADTTSKDRERLQAQLVTVLSDQSSSQARINDLQKELGELVTDYEQLVRMEVEAESEREVMEETVDRLRKRVEELEMRLSDERVRWMGKGEDSLTNGNQAKGVNGDATRGGNVRRSADGVSVAVMRNEFKKMMREARAEHYQNLKAEQDERRRLEAILRSYRREQVETRSSILSGTSQEADPVV